MCPTICFSGWTKKKQVTGSGTWLKRDFTKHCECPILPSCYVLVTERQGTQEDTGPQGRGVETHVHCRRPGHGLIPAFPPTSLHLPPSAHSAPMNSVFLQGQKK